MNLPLSLTALALLAIGATAEEPSRLERVKFNHPGLEVDLAVGLWAWPLPLDFDGDGCMDLVVNCPDKPFNGLWLFRHPGGSKSDPFPVFTFECGDAVVEKSVFMAYGSNTTVIEYRLIAAPKNSGVRLEARPLIAFRDYHSTTHENQGLDGRIQQEPGRVSVQPYAGLPRLYLAHTAQHVQIFVRLLKALYMDRGLPDLLGSQLGIYGHGASMRG